MTQSILKNDLYKVITSQEKRISRLENSLNNITYLQLFKTVAQSIPNVTFTAVTWDSINAGTLSGKRMFDLSDPSKITVRNSGIFGITTSFTWAASAGGDLRYVNLGKNLVAQIEDRQAVPGGHNSTNSISQIFDLNKDDEIIFNSYQDSGGALDIINGRFHIYLLDKNV